MFQRLSPVLALSLALSAAPVAATEIGEMSDAERAAFGAEVRSYLLENPEVLLEVIEVLDQRQAEAQIADDQALISVNAEALFNDGYSYVAGNPEGDVTIVEFVDYRCGYCRKAFPEVNELLDSDGNIRLILKEFPILGEESVLSSRFAISAQILLGDAAYLQIHDALMTLRGNATDESLVALADDLGLDGAAILAGFDNPVVDQTIGANHALAQRMQISGTPSFVVGDQMLRGYLPLEEMRSIVDEVRAAQDS